VFFPLFILFVVFQRLAELVIAKKNGKRMLSRGAVEFDSGGYKFIVIMHTLFFLCIITEYYSLHRALNDYWLLFLSLFICAQLLRYWSIFSLGESWNTRIIILKGSNLIKTGPYRFIAHPNYTAVVTEIAVIPLIFSCYITAIIFSFLNLLIIRRRIKIEETNLKELTN
jgi:methyltransferase